MPKLWNVYPYFCRRCGRKLTKPSHDCSVTIRRHVQQDVCQYKNQSETKLIHQYPPCQTNK